MGPRAGRDALNQKKSFASATDYMNYKKRQNQFFRPIRSTLLVALRTKAGVARNHQVITG